MAKSQYERNRDWIKKKNNRCRVCGSLIRPGAKTCTKHINLGRKRPDMAGNKHWGWKGDSVGYHSIHRWVEKRKGKPKKCEDCGNENAIRYDWSNIDHKYRRVLNDYIRLCAKCHFKYDRIVLGVKRRWG